MKSAVALLLVALVGVTCGAEVLQGRRPYEGEVVIRAKVDTDAKAALVDRFQLDIWADHGDHVLDIRVSSLLLDFLTMSGFEFDIYIEDVQALVDEADARIAKYTGSRNDWFLEYHRYDDQIAYYQDMCSANSDICSMSVVGQSVEGRDMYEIHLSRGNPSRAMFIDAGIHAREWISSTTVQYVFTELLNSTLVDDYEWIILPHINPDGYEYSWGSGNRMWRKSRNINPSNPSCLGTDLNRNFPTATWGGAGTSSNPCSDTYHGSGPGSEPEVTVNIERFIAAYNEFEIPVAHSFHSYSQLWLRPLGDTPNDTPDEAGMFALGAAQCEAIHSVHGLTYQNIKSISLYPTTGTTADWYYTESPATSYGAHTYAYTPELRDTGRYGFMLPEDQIIPQGEEIWAAIIVAAQFFN